MQIKADFHVHTNASSDGVSSLSAILARAKKRGIGAIAVCDHNHWFTKADLSRFSPGDILLLPGCEFSTDCGHLLGIFFDFDVPYAEITPPEAGKAEFSALCDRIHALGGVCVLAHPFETGVCPELDFAKVDAVEIFNARAAFKHKNANEKARQLAKTRDIRGVSSSDAHSEWEVGNGHTLLEISERSGEALRQALQKGKIKIFEKNTPAIFKGLSQWVQRVRQRRYAELPKGFLYLGYCLMKDIFKF